MHLYNRKPDEAKKVTRKLCVTAVEDTKVLFTTADIFHKQFKSDFMLEPLKKFTEDIDIEDLKKRVKLNWKFKKTHADLIQKNAIEIHEKTKSNRIQSWLNLTEKKVTNDINITVENSRAKVMNIKYVS